MLSPFVVAALLSLTDPAGDATGNGSLSAPTATLMREREAFDIQGVRVPDGRTFGLEIDRGRASATFPQAILEFYLSSPDGSGGPGTAALLPGSGMRLPTGQSWHYAVRIIGDRVQIFRGQDGAVQEITEASDARLVRSGATLTLTTRLPLPRHFSLYGMAGVYDPFSETGWRQLREGASPWGYAGAQRYPVLDVVAETPALQRQALEGGILPEIRASFSESGWLLLSGAGIVLALGGLAARVVFGRRGQAQPRTDTLQFPPSGDLTLQTPLAPFDARATLGALDAFQRGEAQLVASDASLLPEPEPVVS